MKLQGMNQGSICATEGNRVLIDSGDGFEDIGRLPNPESGLRGLIRTGKTAGKSMLGRLVGEYATANVWWVSATDLVATAGRWIFSSHDRGATWHRRHRLPESSATTGTLPTGFCRSDAGLLLGEYPLDESVGARILRSVDGGRTWQPLADLNDVRHIHAVQYDPFSDDVWVTTGDADDECRIGRLRGGSVDPVGHGSQQWRAVELTFTPSAILWGVDCPYIEHNHVYRLARDSIGTADPEPVCSLPNSVFYSASFFTADAQWIAFSTAVETTRDSSAADRPITGSTKARVVASSSRSEFSDWTEIAAFERRSCVADRYNPRELLPRANAYIYLAADVDRGLVMNPYNTATGNGSVMEVPPDELSARLSSDSPGPRVVP